MEKRGKKNNWKCFRVDDGGLVVCAPPSPSTGIAYQIDSDIEPRFILLPRNESLRINKDGKQLCKAMGGVMNYQNNQKRGQSKQVVSENKYCTVGARPRRSARGVEPGHYKMESGSSKEDWDIVVDGVKRGEQAFHQYMGTNVIRQIREARNVVEWERVRSSNGKEAKIFNGVAFGMNIHLRAHVDHDFTYSVIQVHVDGMEYGLYDKVVCYFCFPRLGVAVPIKPGDFLMINALEYHCVSSRCMEDVDVYCLSCYLKTAVVGGNDNKRVLTKEEEMCLMEFDALGKLETTRKTRRRCRELDV